MICVVYVKSCIGTGSNFSTANNGLACMAGVGNRQHIGHISSFDTSYGSAASSVRLTFSACRSSTNSTQITPSVYTPAPYGPFDSDISSVHLDLYHRELKLCVFVILVQVERFFDDSRHLPRYLADRSRQTLGS